MLHYRLEGAGRRLLLLHPVGLDLTCFDALTRLLAPRHQVLRVDLRGHGRSPMTGEVVALRDYAADADELMTRLDFAPAAVAGFSFGGMVAQWLALAHPASVSALVLGACPSTLTSDMRAALAERGALAERLGMAAVADATLARWFTDDFRARGEAEAVRQRLLTMNAAAWAAAWRAMAELDTSPRLASIRAPTLCLAAECDRSVAPAALHAMAAAIPGAQYDVVAGAPHMLFLEQPGAVAAAITRFIG